MVRAAGMLVRSAGVLVRAARAVVRAARVLVLAGGALVRAVGVLVRILMERRGISADEAFDVLRRASQSLNIKLTTVAQTLVDRRAEI